MKNITKILIAITLIFLMNHCKKDPVNNTTTNTTKINKDSIKRANIEKFVYNDTSMDNLLFIDTTRFYGSFSSFTWDTVFQDLPNRKNYHRYVIREVSNSHPEYNKDEPMGLFLHRFITFGWSGKDYNNNWGKNAYDTCVLMTICDTVLIATAPSYGDASHLILSRIGQDSLQFVEERLKNQPAQPGNYRLLKGELFDPFYCLPWDSIPYIDLFAFRYGWEEDWTLAFIDIKVGRDYKYDSTRTRAIQTDDLDPYYKDYYLNIKYVKLSDGKYHTVGYFKMSFGNEYDWRDPNRRPITGKILMD